MCAHVCVLIFATEVILCECVCVLIKEVKVNTLLLVFKGEEIVHAAR